MDKYNKSVQHQRFHHATWGSPKGKNEGIGKVVWHSLSEDGKVEIVDIKFGDKTYENISVDQLKPVKMEAHGHPADNDKKKKKKKVNIENLKSIVKEAMIEEKFEMFFEKNVPTNPSKWSYYKSQAKKKFDVYPSAYANAWAAKQYKAAGGGWKKG